MACCLVRAQVKLVSLVEQVQNEACATAVLADAGSPPPGGHWDAVEEHAWDSNSHKIGGQVDGGMCLRTYLAQDEAREYGVTL